MRQKQAVTTVVSICFGSPQLNHIKKEKFEAVPREICSTF